MGLRTSSVEVQERVARTVGLRWGLRFVTDVGLAGVRSWGVVRWPA
uniref:Uncharacterized protein n=1 Tax=Fagus sylvatica TaxID=28930 RepID=A0A2N9FBM4_FAGSY